MYALAYQFNSIGYKTVAHFECVLLFDIIIDN